MRFGIYTLFVTAALALCACADSSNHTNPTNGGDTTKLNGLGSHGNADFTVGSTKFTTTDNFFCYDSSDRTLRLMFIRDSFYKLTLVIKHAELRARSYHCGPDSGWYSVVGTIGSGGWLFPGPDTLDLTVTQLAVASHTFSAVFSLKIPSPVVGFGSVDTVRITNAVFAIVPYQTKPSLSAIIKGSSFPGDDRAVVSGVTSLSHSNEYYVTAQVGTYGIPVSKTLTLHVTQMDPGSIQLPGANADVRYYLRDSGVTRYQVIDSQYSTTLGSVGTITIASFDKSTRLLSGTFDATLMNEATSLPMVISNGSFMNVFLEPQ